MWGCKSDDMSIKNDLKKIIGERLANVASPIFIDRALVIMDQSADNKESYWATADKIRKRIALFINEDLATEVFDILKKEIEHGNMTLGTRRKHVRVTFVERVHVTSNGTSCELQAGNLSEGGIFIETKEPFPVGSEVKISLPLGAGTNIQLNGIVVKSNLEHGKHPSGMGIMFKKVMENELRKLRELVK